MDKAIKDEIRKRIRALEDWDAAPSFQEAEDQLCGILTPLLEEDGYQVDRTPPTRDRGLDFTAVRGATDEAEETTLGIEYKHYRQRSVGVKTVHQVLGASLTRGFSRAMVITNSRFTRAAHELVHRSVPVELELLDIDALKAWWARIEIDANIDRQEIEVILKTMSWRFAQLVAQDPENLRKLEWRHIERMLAEVFEGIGFDVELTPPSKDGGKDIILECTLHGQKRHYIVEIKHWRSETRVGGKAIREFLDVLLKEERQGGLYLSTYGYCNNAFEYLTEIERRKLKFGDQEKVVALCQSYLKAESGIWTPQSRLTEVLYEGTI